jgi:hypothetical protein
MNIPQPEHGGNGESVGVVNQWLLLGPVDLRGCPNQTCPNLQRLRLGKARLPCESVAPNPHSAPIFGVVKEFL